MNPKFGAIGARSFQRSTRSNCSSRSSSWNGA